MKKLAEALRALNERNSRAEDFSYLCAEDFSPEWSDLVRAINGCIEVGRERVQLEKRNLEMIHGVISSGMWSMRFDASGRMEAVNWSQAFRRMLGFEDERDFPNTLEAWSDRLHPEDKPATMAAFWSAIGGAGNYDVEYRILTRSGAYRWFHAAGEVARWESGLPAFFIGVFMDVTEKREHGRLLQEKLAAQEALAEAKAEVEKQNDILATLCSDYMAVYRVDFETGRCEVFKEVDRVLGKDLGTVRCWDSYDVILGRYIDNYVLEEDRDYLRGATSKETVLDKLSRRANYFVRHRIRENARGLENFEIHYVSTRQEGGGAVAVVGFRNVDSEVRREEAHRLETRHDIEATLEGSRTGLWSIECEDGAAPRMYANRTMCMLLGVDASLSPEACYETWFSRIDPEYVEMVQEAVAEMRQLGRAEVIYPWNHPALGKIYVRCGGVPDEKYDRAGWRLKGYHQDITETMVIRQRQEKALMEALMEAKRANQAKTKFLSNMSHDIRTPINGILGMLTICENSVDDPERQQECRQKIRTAAEHLLSLINDVLDISKLESGNLVFSQERFDLREVLDSCMSILAPQAEEQGLTLELRCGELAHARLIGSPLHLRQILINIIGNAIKYNRPRGRVLVRVEEQSADGEAAVFRFVVEDTGIGMRAEFMEHIFEAFTQENSDARTNYEGSGLGMAITKHLVEKMGGSISVESAPGVGSKFSVVLPVQIDPEGAQPPREEGEKPPADVSGMKALLVEDNALNREIAQYMLEDAGVTVVNAGNGREALEAFCASAPGEYDCIFMDVMMPVMNGLDATRAIRALDREDAGTVPIIALSANAFAEDVQQALEAGMNSHLAKPLDVNRMLETMAAYRRRP